MSKQILLNTCCGPCSIYPILELEKQNFEIFAFFYKSNIHPYQEVLKREDSLKQYLDKKKIHLISEKNYDLKGFLRDIVFRENERCAICYYKRLYATARLAKKSNFDFFSTTLLYSKMQKHEKIKEIGYDISKEIGIDFYYQDFRVGWKIGIEKSKEENMYRQNYCGCVYSSLTSLNKNGK